MKYVFLKKIVDYPPENINGFMPDPEPISMKQESAKFLVHIRENCKVSQNAVDSVIDGVTKLLHSYLKIGFVSFVQMNIKKYVYKKFFSYIFIISMNKL